MKTSPAKDWSEANQRYLMAALSGVRAALEVHCRRKRGGQGRGNQASSKKIEAGVRQAAAEMPAPPALESLCAIFGLSPFECSALLLCAGIELDSQFAALCAEAQSERTHTLPTWSLALAALPHAHWSALNPSAPLRRWHLIEPGSGPTLTTAPLRIDERVLHYLTGVSHLDERLAGLVEPVDRAGDLAPSHQEVAKRIASCWSQANGIAALPVVQLLGEEATTKAGIVAVTCSSLRLGLHRMSANLLPACPGEIESLQRLWAREAALLPSALLLECDDLASGDPARESAVSRFIENVRAALVVSCRVRRPLQQRSTVALDVERPAPAEQREIWNQVLGTQAARLNGQVAQLVAHFSFTESAIRSACAQAQSRCDSQAAGLDTQSLWEACRAHSRPKLDDLAQRIEAVANWDDLVLPEQQLRSLREIAMHVRQRSRVYDAWGFADKGSRGLGVSALFAGSSGTGKTMAAEVLANELRLDLYRIDLSQVVSKYIGETEKNLRRIFDAAEAGGAILLFDEADALFGKRSEVKDSHDRYANIEVSYLLQRMEAYRGLAILTTNMKSALDSAFLRRIRFIVQFPFPDAVQRARIWQRIFPSATPREGLEVNRLARLNVAGGNIRNIALNAAFLAADLEEPVRMSHLLQAARSEYAKLEKPLTESEAGGWT